MRVSAVSPSRRFLLCLVREDKFRFRDSWVAFACEDAITSISLFHLFTFLVGRAAIPRSPHMTPPEEHAKSHGEIIIEPFHFLYSNISPPPSSQSSFITIWNFTPGNLMFSLVSVALEEQRVNRNDKTPEMRTMLFWAPTKIFCNQHFYQPKHNLETLLTLINSGTNSREYFLAP